MKKVWSLLSYFSLILVCLCVVSTPVEAGYSYEKYPNGPVVKITKYHGYEENIIVPNRLDEYSVQAIGDNAFEDCVMIRSITIPDINFIGIAAFSGCDSLEDFAYTSGISYINSWTFAGCSKLKNINVNLVSSEIRSSAFKNCSSLKVLKLNKNLNSIEFEAFSGCKSLTSINIPNKIKEIEHLTFYNCESLESIDLSNIVTIGRSSFLYCKSLKAVTLSNNLSEINAKAFYGCSSLKNITIPQSVKYIGQDAFGEIPAIVISGYGDSVAENYANENNIPFLDLEGIPLTDFKFDTNALELKVGEEKGLGYTIVPENARNKQVIWKSSDPSIVSVENGRLTSKRVGTADITATTVDGEKTATCRVTVVTPVTGIAIYNDNMLLEVGTTGKLTCEVFPSYATNKTVIWKSDNEKVAMVINGEVTAISPGIATITATTTDGNKTAACKVTVRNPIINFTDVPSNAWYISYVYDLAGEGIINGKGNGIFDPLGNVTRAEFVTILALASDDDMEQYKNRATFQDVPAGKWFSSYVEWAYEKKIVYGTTATTYTPNANISRQEMAAMIKRYADYKKIELPKKVAPITFNDDADIANWAKADVSAMQQAGIINGKGGGIFDPKGNANRAEAATMISILLKL